MKMLLLSGKRALFDWTAASGRLLSSMSFSRSSTGYRTNASGILEPISANLPRFNYSAATEKLPGILIEEQRTNLLDYSQDFTQSAWAAHGAPIITNNNAGAPDGSSTLNKFVRTTTAATYIANQTSKSAVSQPYILSVYAKKGSVGNYLAMRLQGAYPNLANAEFNLNNGTVLGISNLGSGFSANPSIENVGNNIYRCTLYSPTTDTASNIGSYLSFNYKGSVYVDGTDSVSNADGYVWGAQLEQASSASSYISTSSSSVTRAADQLSFTIPYGVSVLRYTFDDGSTQDVSASPGTYTVPTTLNRTSIRRICSV